MMNPDDASHRELEDGAMVRVRSRIGELVAPLEVSDIMMKGVVSLPHGWEHRHKGIKMAVAQEHAGWSVNDITADTLIDEASGTTSLNSVPVWIAKV